MMNQPSSYSADSLTAPSCQGHSFPRSSSAPCNIYRHSSRFWDQLYGPSRLGLGTEVRLWSQFQIYLTGEFSSFSDYQEGFSGFITKQMVEGCYRSFPKFAPNLGCNCTFYNLRVLGIPTVGWLRLIGSFKLQVSFAKEPCKRDYILQKRLII